MNKKIFMLLLATTVLFCSCGNKNNNVVTDFTPVSHWSDDTPRFLDSLKDMNPAERLEAINRRAPQLLPHLVAEAKAAAMCNFMVDSVVFSYGSGEATGVLDSNGARHDGVFKDELVARIYTTPKTSLGQPIIIFVRCLNGLCTIKGDKRVVKAETGFYIREGEGIAHHVPELSEWASICSDLEIPVVENGTGKIVTVDHYLHYLGHYQALVWPGDYVDMVNKVLIDWNGNVVNNFQRIKIWQSQYPKKRR